MSTQPFPEFWLRGALPGISSYLQPVAHALLQANEEVTTMMEDFPSTLLWQKPAEMASPGFHLQHLAGVLDRLFTYARGASLTSSQLAYLKLEGIRTESENAVDLLTEAFQVQVSRCIEALKTITDTELLEPRMVGRAQLPSTVLGLLFHAAEHTMRHTGQLLVTVKVLNAGRFKSGL